MEAFRSSAKWKLLGGHSEDLPSHRDFRHDSPDPSPPRGVRHDTPDPSPPRRARHDTPDPSPPRRDRHDTPDSSPPRRDRHDTPDPSPPRRFRHDTPDPSPSRRAHPASLDPSPLRKPHRHSAGVSPGRTHQDTPDSSLPGRACHHSSESSLPRRARDSSPSQPARTHEPLDTSQLRRVRRDSPHALPRPQSSKAPERASSRAAAHSKGPGPSRTSLPENSKDGYDSDLSPPRKKPAKSHKHDPKDSSPNHRKLHTNSSPERCLPGDSRKASDSDLSPPRQKQSSGHKGSDSDLSPPRNRPAYQASDSDLSPPRRKRRAKSSDSDLSPPRRSQPPGKKAARMYSGARAGLAATDIQREQPELRQRDQETAAFEAESQYAETVFRDKSGRKRNLKLERLEQRRKAERDSKREELYAQWGKGLAQSRQQQQNVEDAVKEMQKPLARYIDDEDLDRMLREQEREGDPMASFIKKSKAKEDKNKKARPRYSGPAPPPNRFNIWPGYRWDGVDRSNGFEQKRFARLASKKAVEELAYKWSVEDM
ncbi:BUD13 homolog isoform X2 [Suricata suricatta]|nr:BUD13 homolog isoform X2 [Suricata suricatta]